MRKTTVETNFEKMVKLGIISVDGAVADHKTSKSGGFMDLVVERVTQFDEAAGGQGIAISLAHYFKQNGDLCSDPDMVVVVFPELKAVMAHSFEQSLPPVCQVVYPEGGGFHPELKDQLNTFLRSWLINIEIQGHGINWIED